MGRLKNNKRKDNSSHPVGKNRVRKRRKPENFWIEACQEKEPNNPKILKHAIHVLITRVQLRDDHFSTVPKDQAADALTAGNENDVSSAVAFKENSAVDQLNEEIKVEDEEKDTTAQKGGGDTLSSLPSEIADKDTASIDSDQSETVESSHDHAKTPSPARPAPFVYIHIAPSAKSKIKVL